MKKYADVINIHFEGQCLECLVVKGKLKAVWCDGIELNITSDIIKAYELQIKPEGIPSNADQDVK